MRTLKPQDLRQISEIEQEVFSDPWSYEMLKSSSEHYRCWVLESKDNDLILGYLVGQKVIDEFSIFNLAIRPGYQKKGLGSLFVKKVIHTMQIEGCRKFFLEVRKSNVAAKALYSKLGFRELYQRKNYYSRPQEDAVVMIYEIKSNEEGNYENL